MRPSGSSGVSPNVELVPISSRRVLFVLASSLLAVALAGCTPGPPAGGRDWTAQVRSVGESIVVGSADWETSGCTFDDIRADPHGECGQRLDVAMHDSTALAELLDDLPATDYEPGGRAEELGYVLSSAHYAVGEVRKLNREQCRAAPRSTECGLIMPMFLGHHYVLAQQLASWLAP